MQPATNTGNNGKEKNTQMTFFFIISITQIPKAQTVDPPTLREDLSPQTILSGNTLKAIPRDTSLGNSKSSHIVRRNK